MCSVCFQAHTLYQFQDALSLHILRVDPGMQGLECVDRNGVSERPGNWSCGMHAGMHLPIARLCLVLGLGS